MGFLRWEGEVVYVCRIKGMDVFKRRVGLHDVGKMGRRYYFPIS